MSSEYGWDDETIWNLPISRFRQITAAIQQRRFLSAREENSRFSWLARNLGGFIAGGYMLDKGAKNPAAEQARTLSFDEIEAVLLGAEVDKPTAAQNHPLGPDGKAVDIDPNEAIARALAKNGNGSFERFGMMAGQLAQRGKML